MSLLHNIFGGKRLLLAVLFFVFLSFSTVLSPEIAQGQICGCVRKKDVGCVPTASTCGATETPTCIDKGGVCGCECRPGAGKNDGVVKFYDLERVTLKDAIAGQPLSAPLQQVLPYVFAAAGTALLVFIIYSGYRMMLSRGDPKAMAAGRQALMYGILGIVIIFIAYWIVVVVGAFFGITPFNDVFIDS